MNGLFIYCIVAFLALHILHVHALYTVYTQSERVDVCDNVSDGRPDLVTKYLKPQNVLAARGSTAVHLCTHMLVRTKKDNR